VPELFGRSIDLGRPPHRVVDELLDSVVKLPKELSEAVSSALDRGPLGPSGPHRAVDAIVKSIGTAVEVVGEGIASALDVPLKAVRR